MSDPIRAALQQLADAVDGWGIDPAANDPLVNAMIHARKVLQTAEEGERLSSGKLVSERIIELLDEVEQRGLATFGIIVGTRAEQLLRKEMCKAPGKAPLFMRTKKMSLFVQDDMYFQGLSVTKIDSEAAEYVAIECG